MSGCIIAELGLEMEAVSATEGVTIGTGEAALTRGIVTTGATGELSIVSAEGMNSLLGEVRLEKVFGESPKLYIEGRTAPFAEVYAKSGRIRLLSKNEFFSIPDNIFSVEGESVNVRSGAIVEPNNIVAQVRQGDLLVKLAEKDGWYQVKLVQKGYVYYGWIEGIYVLPLIASDKERERKKKAIRNRFAFKPIAVKDYAAFVNQSICQKVDISILIIDTKGKNFPEASNAVAEVYTQSGKRTCTGLLKESFLLHSEFQGLFDGNPTIIKNLNVAKYTDYLGLGKISCSFRSGTLVQGTVICSASITMNIISVKNHSLVRSFTVPVVNGNGVTEQQARDEAIYKLVNNYFTDYSMF